MHLDLRRKIAKRDALTPGTSEWCAADVDVFEARQTMRLTHDEAEIAGDYAAGRIDRETAKARLAAIGSTLS